MKTKTIFLTPLRFDDSKRQIYIGSDFQYYVDVDDMTEGGEPLYLHEWRERFKAEITKFNDQVEKIRLDLFSSSAKILERIKAADFETFSMYSPYSGDFKNKIFFTWSDHYSGNNGSYMSVNELLPRHPYYNIGVATDLTGYLALQCANNLSCDYAQYQLHIANIGNSKHRDTYMKIWTNLKNDAIESLNETVKFEKKIINKYLLETYKMALLNFLQPLSWERNKRVDKVFKVDRHDLMRKPNGLEGSRKNLVEGFFRIGAEKVFNELANIKDVLNTNNGFNGLFALFICGLPVLNYEAVASKYSNEGKNFSMQLIEQKQS